MCLWLCWLFLTVAFDRRACGDVCGSCKTSKSLECEGLIVFVIVERSVKQARRTKRVVEFGSCGEIGLTNVECNGSGRG